VSVADLTKLSVSTRATLREVIRVIDEGAVQVALAINDDGVLLGTVTDGDIRRGLLRGASLDTAVEDVMNRDFASLEQGAAEDDALSLMRRETLHQVPVLDAEGRVTHLFLLEELLNPQPLPNTVVIMAGGQGRRLLPLTNTSPKPMLLVAGRPMLEIVLQRCLQAGFRNFYISVNHLKEQIIEYFGDGSRWGVSIAYLEEDSPMGTAGALGLLPTPPAEPVVVVNGDVLTRVDFRQLLRFHSEHAASGTVCVRAHDTQIPYGVVTTDGVFLKSVEEKPIITHYISAGIYVLDHDVMQLVPVSERKDMPALLTDAMKAKLPIAVFPIHEYWLDTGHPEALAQANGEWE
jgi:dTDP-glucose pyrophosphorylase